MNNELVILCELNADSPERFGLESRLQELEIEYKTSIQIRYGRGNSQEVVKFEVLAENEAIAKQELLACYRRNYKNLNKINWKMLLLILAFLGLLLIDYCR